MTRLNDLVQRVAVVDTRSAKPAAKAVDSFYTSPRWRALVAGIISKRGRRCEDPLCEYTGRTGMRVFGDHIVELQDGGAPLDEHNVMLRCGSCHTRKTNLRRDERARTRY